MLYRISLILLITVSSCICKKPFHPLAELKVEAQHYHAAMGSGNGVLFRFNGSESQKDSLWIDSLIIAGKMLPIAQSSWLPIIAEANYFVPSPEVKEDHSKMIEADAILNKQYQPAYLYLHDKNNQSYKYPLTSITSTQTLE